MQPSPGHNCFLILLGGSKHSLALPLSLTLLGRKIFQRAGQHPGQRQAPTSAPQQVPALPFPQMPLQKQEALNASHQPQEKDELLIKILSRQPLSVPPAFHTFHCSRLANSMPSLLYTFDYAPLLFKSYPFLETKPAPLFLF